MRWPTAAPAYRELKTDERVRELLRYNSAREAVWRTTDSAEINYMFFFRWNPGAATILRARAHRPDVCLPSAGWKQIGVVIGCNRSLLAANARFHFAVSLSPRPSQRKAPVRAHAYYCLHEDRVHAAEKNGRILFPIGTWPIAGAW